MAIFDQVTEKRSGVEAGRRCLITVSQVYFMRLIPVWRHFKTEYEK